MLQAKGGLESWQGMNWKTGDKGCRLDLGGCFNPLDRELGSQGSGSEAWQGLGQVCLGRTRY